jgi:Vacuolar-sorting-associated 13 protein C-terminal
MESMTLGIDNLQLNCLLEVVNGIMEVMESEPAICYLHKYFYLLTKETAIDFKLTEDSIFTYPFQPQIEYHLITPPVS